MNFFLFILRDKYTSIIFRVILGVTFVYASIHKLMHPFILVQTICSYNILPDDLINIFALTLPWLELSCGFFLIIGLFRQGSVLILNFLLILFFLAVSINLYRGSNISCGCFGMGAIDSLNFFHIAANVFLLAMGIQILLYDQKKMGLDSLLKKRSLDEKSI